MNDLKQTYPFGAYKTIQSVDNEGVSSVKKAPEKINKYETIYVTPPSLNPGDQAVIIVPEESIVLRPESSIFINGILISSSEYTILNNVVTLENIPQENSNIVIVR
jgi:hypothetical protein